MITSDTAVGAQLSEEAESNPRILNVGTLGPPQEEIIELLRLKEKHKIEVMAPPFNSNAEMVQALLAGNVDATLVNSSEDIVRQLGARKFRPLAAAPEERAPYFPETPALKELGYRTLTHATPAGTTEDTTGKLKETPQVALENPEVREELGEDHVPDEFIGSEELCYLGPSRSRLPTSRYWPIRVREGWLERREAR